MSSVYEAYLQRFSRFIFFNPKACSSSFLNRMDIEYHFLTYGVFR
jgi:hypothetical protein